MRGGNLIKSWSDLGHRDTYGKTIIEMARDNPSIVAMSADLADATRITAFSRLYPGQFVQTGIAEQNMVGVAAGLATSGKVPFVSTFASFASMRCCEQVRTDLAYQNLNVKIVGIDGGVATEYLGATHYSLEDIAIMRAMPNMTVLCPSDGYQLHKLLYASLIHCGPVYFRLCGGKNLTQIYYEPREFPIGGCAQVVNGEEAVIFACGLMVAKAVEAAAILKSCGIDAGVVDVYSVKPFDAATVAALVSKARLVVSMEEHNVTGGLGAAIAEVLGETGAGCKLIRLGLPDAFFDVGCQSEIFQRFGLTVQNLADTVIKELGARP